MRDGLHQRRAMARHYKNWISGFLEWVMPRSEAPKSFLDLVALFGLACSVRKHVKIPRSAGLGGWECYPNVYIVLAAEPGVARKTTTMDFVDEILKDLTNAPAAPTFMTQASLMSTLAESPDGSIYITASELGSLIQKSKNEMFEFLTDGYDSRKAIRGRTILRGHEVIENPCINMMACTQPGWMQENMPASVINGGFASRTIFAFEAEPRIREMYWDNVDYSKLDDIRIKLLEDLEHIAQIKGEFTIASNAKDWMSTYYKTQIPIEVEKADHRLKGYYARKHVHLHKFAMLYHMARSDELVLELRDFTEAWTLLSYIEKNIIKIFSKFGRNEYMTPIEAIRSFMKERRTVPLTTLYAKFEGVAEPSKLQTLIQFFILTGEVDVSQDEGEIVYTYVETKAPSSLEDQEL